MYDTGDSEGKSPTIPYASRQPTGLALHRHFKRTELFATDAHSSCVTLNPELEAGPVEQKEEEEEEIEQPKLSIPITIALFVITTALIGVTADYLVSSIDGFTASASISKEFLGLILLPIAGNAIEHVTSAMVSAKDRLSLSLGLAVESSIVSLVNKKPALPAYSR